MAAGTAGIASPAEARGEPSPRDNETGAGHEEAEDSHMDVESGEAADVDADKSNAANEEANEDADEDAAGEHGEAQDEAARDGADAGTSESAKGEERGNSEEAGDEAADGEAGEDKAASDENNDENNEDVEGNSAEPGEQIDPLFDEILLKPLFERREKSLKELLESMDEFAPIIPDAVTDYYLAKSGFRTTDHRVKRLLALATQKFVADIASDAYQFARIRAQTANAAGGSGRGRAGPGSTSGRTVLTMESLSGVLGEYGVNAKRPDFYR